VSCDAFSRTQATTSSGFTYQCRRAARPKIFDFKSTSAPLATLLQQREHELSQYSGKKVDRRPTLEMAYAKSVGYFFDPIATYSR